MEKVTKTKSAVCEIFYVDEKKVKAAQKAMKPDEVFVKVAQTFKALADLTRAKIIFALYKEELCVCDLAAILNISQSAISHQLRILRNLDLVKYRKNGRVVYYSLDDEHIENLFEECLRHVEEKWCL